MYKNKKLIITLFLLMLVLVISACSGDNNNDGASDEQDGSEKTAQNGDASSGEAIYESNCMSCHGADGEGENGPDLTGESDYDEVVDQVKKGGGSMPAFEDDLSEQEINDVAAFITEEVAG